MTTPITITIDGKPVPLDECGWLQRRPCGCIVAAVLAVVDATNGGWVLATADQAHQHLNPTPLDQARAAQAGLRTELITMRDYRNHIGANWACARHQPAASPGDRSSPATRPQPVHTRQTRPATREDPMTDQTLPHDPYISAVVDALTAAGLEPTTAETRDTEENRFDLDGCGTELDALLVWDGDAPGLDTDLHENGLVLLWEHPAEQWQWAPRKQHGELEWEPEFLPKLGRWSDPAAVVTTVRALLAGEPLPEGYAPYWHPADAVRRAVDAWVAAES